VAIAFTFVSASRRVRRVLDGIDEPTMRMIEASAAAVPGVEHALGGEGTLGGTSCVRSWRSTSRRTSRWRGHDIAERVRAALLHDVPRLGMRWHVDPHEHESHLPS
jgi:hypothetical protein